jgi:hypothetical protein
MFRRLIIQMREKIRRREYVVTLHADEEMAEDGFNVYDLEKGVLTGRILERQKDGVTSEWKYRILGKAVDKDKIELVAKLSITGKLVIITVYKP